MSKLELHTDVDDAFEQALTNLIAIWASAHNPVQVPEKTLEVMDRLGWMILNAGAIYGDIHIMESGHALRDEAKVRGFVSELL